MKTAISISDHLFEAADKLARHLGMSRSELYSNAVAEYVRNRETSSLTEAMNRVCDEIDTSLDPVIAAIQYASLPREEW